MNANIASLRATAAVVSMLGCCCAQAGEDAPAVTIGGFGTVGVVHGNNNQADFTANALNPGDAGASRAWSAAVDSRVGAQMALYIDSNWSAVLQLVSERTLRNGYAPAVEWAYVQYQATPDLGVRVGRISLPLFLTGDYRKAGYALPWLRPPVELYGAIPVSNSDGVDLNYRWQAGDVHNVTQVSLGRADRSLSPDARAQAQGLTGISNTATAGALSVRASVLTAQVSVDILRSLFDGLRGFGAQGQALADRYEASGKRAYVAALGFSYDPGQWFMTGEFGRMNARSYLGDRTAAYLGAGRRYGDLTPYAVYSASRANMSTRVDGVDVSGLPPAQATVGMQLNAGLNQLLATIPRQHSISAGVRWDLHTNYALKLQYDRITPQQGSSGTFINVQPGFTSGRSVTVLSAAVDFVF